MNWLLLRNSLVLGAGSTLLSVSFGFLSALWLACLPAHRRPGVLAAAVIALVLPPFLVTNSWLHFLGLLGSWHTWLPLNIFSLGGAVWILSLLLWPLSLLLVWGAWQRLEAVQLESDLLVTGWALVRVLMVPLSRNALIQAAFLTFVLAVNNFAVPSILQVKVLPAEMWIRFNTEFDTGGALRLSSLLVIGPVLLVLWFSRHEFAWPHLQAPVPGPLLRQQLGPILFWTSAVCSVLLLFCSLVLPLSQILSSARTWNELPGAWAAGQAAVWNSFWYAAGAATITGGISLCWMGFLKGRRPKAEIRMKAEGRDPKSTVHRESNLTIPALRFRPPPFRIPDFGFRISSFLSWLPFLLPGVLLGIGLIHAFNHDWSAWLYQGAGIVVLAFVIRYLVIAWHAIGQAAHRVDRDLIDVAQVEGATPGQLFRHVLWPQITRPVLAAWYIVFLLCLWDVESMILVVPPGGETLALRIFNLLHYGHNAQVNALCFILLGVALIPLLLETIGQTLLGACRASRRFSPVPSADSISRHLLKAFFVAAFSMTVFTACRPSAKHSKLQSTIFDRVEIIGVRGVGVGQLNKPRSVAVDSSDNLFVVDMTGRVQKFSSNGVFQLSWQMPQTERGKPKGMGRDRHGNILVVEPHYSRVNLFSPMGKLLSQWGTHGTNAGQLSMPRAVAANSRDEFFVSEYQEIERVQKFVLGPTEPPNSRQPNTTDFGQPPHWSTGFGQAGTGPAEFNRPEGLCVDAQDRVYVADSCNHRIQVFTSDGKFLRTYGKAGTAPGELSYPYDICVDEQGRQYVCEFGNSRIQVFDAHDKPIEIIGGPGAAPGRFSNPWGVALDSAGNLYVADSQNHRVQKFISKR